MAHGRAAIKCYGQDGCPSRSRRARPLARPGTGPSHPRPPEEGGWRSQPGEGNRYVGGHKAPGRPAWFIILAVITFGLAPAAFAHAIYNAFNSNRYTKVTANGREITLAYAVIVGDVPAFGVRTLMDTNHDNLVSEAEATAYATDFVRGLNAGLAVTLDSVALTPDFTGTVVSLNDPAVAYKAFAIDTYWTIPATATGRHILTYRDESSLPALGETEAAFEVKGNATFERAFAGQRRDEVRSSFKTTGLPAQMGDLATYSFEFTIGAGAPVVVLGQRQEPGAQAGPSQAPGIEDQGFSYLRGVLGGQDLGAGVIALALVVAFFLGAGHALSPGHGKTVVAAYLIGNQGTVWHAVILGAVVTFTHTFSVVILGVVTLYASQYIVPERLYPILGTVSGVLIVVMGLTLLKRRLQALLGLAPGHGHHHDHGHTHDHDHAHDYGHTHDHGHPHDSAHHHTPAHSGRRSWWRRLNEHSHAAPRPGGAPVRAIELLSLGVSGGIVPCPSATVVLLAATAFGRIALGLLLIQAFSLGLALVLIGIGVAMVKSRGLFDRIPVSGGFLEKLPVASAAIITLLGAVITVRAVAGVM